MGDMRFLMIGIVLVFVGFLVLGVLGGVHQNVNLESSEFGNCYEYSDNKEPVPIDCSFKLFDQVIFFGIVVSFIIAGIISLVKGVRGDWDSKVKSKDMVGPGEDKNIKKEDSED